MAYVIRNPKTKKAAKQILMLGAPAKDVIFQPGIGTVPEDGFVSVEGPHAPAAHTWYANVQIQKGRIIKVS